MDFASLLSLPLQVTPVYNDKYISGVKRHTEEMAPGELSRFLMCVLLTNQNSKTNQSVVGCLFKKSVTKGWGEGGHGHPPTPPAFPPNYALDKN